MSQFKTIVVLCLLHMVFIMPSLSEAGNIYHATYKATARRIVLKGIDPTKFKLKTRYGKVWYGSKRPSTALAEKGSRSSLIRMRTTKYLDKNSWDLRKPNKVNLKSYVGDMNLRGKYKNRIIGPKLGRKLGEFASQQRKAIKYTSAKNGGTNFAVPESMLKKHPRALSHPEIIQYHYH